MIGQPYYDLLQLASMAIKHESLLKEKEIKDCKGDLNFIDGFKLDDDKSQAEYAEIVVAKMIIEKPYAKH